MWRIASILLLIPSFAAAGELVTPDKSNPYPPLPGVDYHCRGPSGERYELGEVACLINNSCTGAWLAKCDMTNRVPMWRKTMDGCPGASLLDRLQGLDPPQYSPLVHPEIAAPKSQAS